MGGANTQSSQSNQHPDSIRTDGTVKGSGFLGGIKRIDDPSKVSSELSIGVDWGSGEKLIPQMVPTLDDNEINYLLSTSEDKIKTENPDLNKSITQKAVRFAREREALGLPYFAQENESPKQKTNTMGGANTQSKPTEAQAYDQLIKQGMSGSPDESLGGYIRGGKKLVNEMIGGAAPRKPVAPDNEQATIDRLNKQGMSGMADESLGHYLRGGKQLVKEMLDPNYNRNVARPVSSYEAIDEGLK
jgi:hypothetical protein